MTRRLRAIAAVALACLLGACASVPRDAGFADVQRTVEEATRQPVRWDPRTPVHPPDDGAVAALLREELSADRAVEIALASNRDVQATLEELGIARAELMAASTIRNPIFHGEIRFPGEPRNPVEFGVTKTLVDLFQYRSRRRVGRAQFEATRVRVGGAIINFATEVRTDYYDLLAARKILARHDTIMKAQEAATDLARRQHESGNISDLDLENEQARYEQVKLEYARAQLDELQARERLIADLGLMRRADIKLPPEFPPIPDRELTAEGVEAEVAAQRLDLHVAQRELEAAERAFPTARLGAFDELEITIHHEREPDGTRTTGPELTVPIPIFDRGAAQKAGARALLRQAQQRFAALNVSARSEARAALERLIEARARMTYIREVVVPRRERILNLTQLEYNAMLRGVFQLIEARQNLATAHREEIVASRDYWVARTELDAAMRGVGGFSVRPEGRAERRMDLFPPLTPIETKVNE